MACCHCEGVEEEFNEAVARRQLRRYRRRGPKRTTRWLLEAIKQHGAEGKSFLDIGGGIGEIQHELAAAGVARVTSVEASSAYQEMAREEARAKGYLARATYVHGDFVDASRQIVPSDIVTLDRVICCYHDVDGLVSASASRARRFYGVVFPRVAWWTRFGFRLIKFVQWVRRASFIPFLHPPARVEGLLAREGFDRTFHRTSLLWRVSLYERL